MSDLGAKQRQVLDLLGSGSLTTNRLIWQVAVDEGRVPGFEGLASVPAERELPRSIYESVRRAVHALEERGEIELRAERPNARGIVASYPYQTRSLLTAFLRLRLLKPLIVFATGAPFRNRGKPRYSRAENEHFVLGARMSDEERARLHDTWASVDEQLRATELLVPAELRTALFELRIKCAELCDPKARFRHDRSLGELIAAAHTTESSQAFAPVLEAVQQLYSLMPEQEISRARLKTALYSVADMDRSLGPHIQLTNDAMDALHAQSPEIVGALPGFSENVRRRQLMEQRHLSATRGIELGEIGVLHQPRYHHSPQLARFIGKDMFRPFQIVSLASQSKSAS
ncbi:MAG: hypothetical protein ACHREM_03405 [Polyangiales bacterium]